MNERKLVFIEWLDHCSFDTSEWRDQEEYDELEPVLCQTVGYIVKETEDMIAVVQTVSNVDDADFNQKFAGDMCIIKGCIKVMKEL